MIKIAYSPLFCHPVPETHRFPMAKYRLIPQQLLKERIIQEHALFHPQLASETEILSTHTLEYWQKLKTGTLSRAESRRIGFEMSKELITRERYIAHATYECALYAKEYGISLSVSGGTHHAFADHGEGFCILNDVCLASNLLLARRQAKRILIVDLDVHQGNGNAMLMTNTPNVFVFSMHGKKNYPFYKPPSTLDIEFDDGTTDEMYLTALYETLPSIIATFAPELIFYQSAVDILATDVLGKLSISMQGCSQRDEFVLMTAYQQGIPIAVVMGGGYSADIKDTVEAHCQTFRLAHQIWQ